MIKIEEKCTPLKENRFLKSFKSSESLKNKYIATKNGATNPTSHRMVSTHKMSGVFSERWLKYATKNHKIHGITKDIPKKNIGRLYFCNIIQNYDTSKVIILKKKSRSFR
jgi:hypothetical protein